MIIVCVQQKNILSTHPIIKLNKLYTIDVENVNNDYGTKLQVSSCCYWTMKQYTKYIKAHFLMKYNLIQSYYNNNIY